MALKPRKATRRTSKAGRSPAAGRPPAAPLNIPWPTPACDLMTAVELIAQHAGRPFTLDEAVAAIRQHARVRNPDPKAHVRSLLSDEPDLARIPEDESYIPAHLVFQNAAFCIAPTEAELREGMLVPGHRFYPFMSMARPPDEVALYDENGEAFPKRTFRSPFGAVVIYHTLLPLFSTISICNRINDDPFEAFDEDTPVEVDVFDLSGFYRTHGVNEKGLIIVRVLDVAGGTFQATYADAATRFSLQKGMREQDGRIERYLARLMPETGPDLPLHLLRDAYAHLYRDGVDLSLPASPFGPWLAQSKRVTVGYYRTHPCLVPPNRDPMGYYAAFELPEYDGRCETMEDLFEKAGLSLEMAYVRAVILDMLDHDGNDRNGAVERLFRGRGEIPWDAEDRAFFRQEFDRLWDEVVSRRQELSPNKPVQALRRKILEACDRHLAMLRNMDQRMVMPEDLPMEEMTQLAMLDGLYNKWLALLEASPSLKELRETERIFKNLQEMAEPLWAALEKAADEAEEQADELDEELWDVLDEEGEDEEYVETLDGPVAAYALRVKFAYDRRIWRTIEVAGHQSLHALHLAIQDAIGWDDDHLYSFFMSNRAWDSRTEYASPYAEEGRSAAEVTLDDLRLKRGKTFLYLFDYGDEHRFEVEVLDIRTDAPSGEYPRLVEARGDAPEQYPEEE